MGEEIIEHRKRCHCGGFIYQDGDFVICINCGSRCIAKRKTDKDLPNKEEAEKLFIEQKTEFHG